MVNLRMLFGQKCPGLPRHFVWPPTVQGAWKRLCTDHARRGIAQHSLKQPINPRGFSGALRTSQHKVMRLQGMLARDPLFVH
jgi:hypothetical protein